MWLIPQRSRRISTGWLRPATSSVAAGGAAPIGPAAATHTVRKNIFRMGGMLAQGYNLRSSPLFERVRKCLTAEIARRSWSGKLTMSADPEPVEGSVPRGKASISFTGSCDGEPTMRIRLGCTLVAVMLIWSGAQSPRAQQKAGPPPPKKSPFLKLVEAWPEEEVLQARRTEADTRRLFKELDPIAFTLTADFKAINKERDPASTKRFPAVLSRSEEHT